MDSASMSRVHIAANVRWASHQPQTADPAKILMSVPSRIFVSLELVIICLECSIVFVMMVMNWTEQEETVQILMNVLIPLTV